MMTAISCTMWLSCWFAMTLLATIASQGLAASLVDIDNAGVAPIVSRLKTFPRMLQSEFRELACEKKSDTFADCTAVTLDPDNRTVPVAIKYRCPVGFTATAQCMTACVLYNGRPCRASYTCNDTTQNFYQDCRNLFPEKTCAAADCSGKCMAGAIDQVFDYSNVSLAPLRACDRFDVSADGSSYKKILSDGTYLNITINANAGTCSIAGCSSCIYNTSANCAPRVSYNCTKISNDPCASTRNDCRGTCTNRRATRRPTRRPSSATAYPTSSQVGGLNVQDTGVRRPTASPSTAEDAGKSGSTSTTVTCSTTRMLVTYIVLVAGSAAWGHLL